MPCAGLYLEIDKPDEPREPGRWLWSELEGLAVRGTNGEELGRIVEIYRAGGAEVFVVRGPRGEIDIPGVHGIVTDLAPERGELIVDLDALALDARPVEDDYVRPARAPAAEPEPIAHVEGRARGSRCGRAGRRQRRGPGTRRGRRPTPDPDADPG